MTYTKSTWTTVAVARVKADYVVVSIADDGTERAREANMALTQMHDSGGRRTILGVVDTETCEIVPAPDVAGFKELRCAAVWAATPRTIELRQQ
ncbi:hypothetical protein JRC04_06915 [Mycolicibacterium sp. S2-37]|uniref:hypothetical protein n=1 Tax=Mycolicibacterium sp. S2-37 TaxID=2810297 RepID=UPI001A941495|nr:hypothetical protein [Mycolicibacterium sp. S2-37]MBO0677191.1 hypothetical protein [Mycolicibacterium sp. S2-37]